MDAGVIEGTSAELKSVSGDINLDLLGDVNAVLELEAGLGGEIKNSLSNDKIEKAFMGRQKLTTQIGDGASEVVIRTVSADIRIE